MTSNTDQTIVLSEPETPQILLVDIPGVGKKYVKVMTVNSTSEQETAQYQPNEIFPQQVQSLPTMAGPGQSFTIDEDVSRIVSLSSPRSSTSRGTRCNSAELVTQAKQFFEKWSAESENDSDSDCTDGQQFSRPKSHEERTPLPSWGEPAIKKPKESNENITQEDLLKFGRLLNKLVSWTNENDKK